MVNSHWTYDSVAACGPHQTSILMAHLMAAMSNNSCDSVQSISYEIRPQEKGGFVTAHPSAGTQQITTNLVTDLPESEGMTAIAIFVDQLSKGHISFPATRTSLQNSMLDFSLTTSSNSMVSLKSSSLNVILAS